MFSMQDPVKFHQNRDAQSFSFKSVFWNVKVGKYIGQNTSLLDLDKTKQIPQFLKNRIYFLCC